MVLKALDGDTISWFAVCLLHFDTIAHNYLYQGLLDLHGALYNPNSGQLVGHLPAVNFMDFVRAVTEDLLKNTLENNGNKVPYELHLTPPVAHLGKQVKIGPDEFL